MIFPTELKYNQAHLWVRIEGEFAYLGITDYAQDQLGELLYVEMPAVDEEIPCGEKFSEVESGKNTSVLILPFGGKVVEINERVDDEPNYINSAPYEAWIAKFEILDPTGLEKLISSADYMAGLA